MQYPNQYIEVCLEGNNSVFNVLNPKEKEAIVQNHAIFTVKKGDILLREGEKPKGLICLASGKIKVYKEGVGGREQILKMVKQPGLIGYRALYSDSACSFSLAAIEDSVLCIVEKNILTKVLKKNAELGVRLIKLLAEELDFSYYRTVSLTQKHIRGRLAESLIILRDTYGTEKDGKTIGVSLSREDIASFSNMTTSNAIRTLSVMKSEGIIKIAGRKISILDSQSLEHICELG
jgi:CRP/FNR family transcriptional regulator, polysaccharide utilization system transcription regulator